MFKNALRCSGLLKSTHKCKTRLKMILRHKYSSFLCLVFNEEKKGSYHNSTRSDISDSAS
jgi:hypothetical protein